MANLNHRLACGSLGDQFFTGGHDKTYDDVKTSQETNCKRNSKATNPKKKILIFWRVLMSFVLSRTCPAGIVVPSATNEPGATAAPFSTCERKYERAGHCDHLQISYPGRKGLQNFQGHHSPENFEERQGKVRCKNEGSRGAGTEMGSGLSGADRTTQIRACLITPLLKRENRE